VERLFEHQEDEDIWAFQSLLKEVRSWREE
jgi:hypothetical protein